MWIEDPIFKEELDKIVSCDNIPWYEFDGRTILVTGATGLIGYTAVCALLYYNKVHEANINVLALVRDVGKANVKFGRQLKEECLLTFVTGSVETITSIPRKIDYIIHGACPTASKYFSEHPVETVNSIVEGTKNILELARQNTSMGVVFLSSMEVYGTVTERRKLTENDLGTIDIFSVRSGYPEGKRFSENMCVAYASEYGVPVTTARLAQTFGPGVEKNDGRVFAYMARCAMAGEDILLNTDGSKENMYLYTFDAVSAILMLLVKGERGTSYNVGNPDTYCSVKEMGEVVAKSLGEGKITVKTNCGSENDEELKKIYRPQGYLLMDVSKLMALGWKPTATLAQMFERMSKCFYEDERTLITSVGAAASIGMVDPYDVLLKRFNALNKRLDKTDRAIRNVSEKTDGFGKKFKRKIKKAAKNPNIFGRLTAAALRVHDNIKKGKIRRSFSKLDIEENKVFAITFDKRYNCNPKYIVEELLRQELPLQIVWVTPATGAVKASDYPAGVKLVRYGSADMYEEMSTAKVWIDNALNCVWDNGMKKKPGQVYLNTWHGSLGIKRLSGDKYWMSRAKLCNKSTDHCISNSKFEEDVYKDTFWKDVPYLRYGHARNDILFNTKAQLALRAKVCAYFKIGINKKILLYAPTFRDDGSLDWCDLDFERVREILAQRFGGDWVILLRKHFKNRAKDVSSFVFDEHIKDATKYVDIQELLAVVDAGLTDYSSWAFDYVLTRRPLFLYATDLDKYDSDRGFYYPLEETPFPIAHNAEEFENNILTFNEDDYLKKVEDFLNGKECMDDGHACERIVDYIKEVTNTTDV